MSQPFGTYVRDKRVAAGISLRELAALLEVSHVYLGEVERGVKRKLPEKYWPILIEHVAGITQAGLERAERSSRSLDERVGAMSEDQAELMHALARKIESKDLDPDAIRRALGIKE